jgi:hypothetical protein
MPRSSFLNRSQLLAAATAVAAAGLFTAAAPAQAADCAQWGFPGATTMQLSSGEFITFNSGGSNAGGAAQWNKPNGTSDSGTISGNINSSGAVALTFHDNDGDKYNFSGQAGPDGTASGTSGGPTWTITTPLTCAAKQEGGGAAPAPAGTPETRCIPDPFNLNFPGAC